MDNAVRDRHGNIIGFRCASCDKVKSKMWGNVCNACRILRERLGSGR